MLWVGLTGGIASGKTTVSNILREMAIPIIDADRLAHQALRVHQDKIVTYFGRDILGPDGEIDRPALGSKVFASNRLKKRLEDVIHPYVQEKVIEKKRLFEVAGHPVVVYDVPLLFENNLQDSFDHVIVVYVPEEVSVQRLMERNKITEGEAKQRISNQINIERKKELADTVFDNQGDRDSLKEQVIKWKEDITKG